MIAPAPRFRVRPAVAAPALPRFTVDRVELSRVAFDVKGVPVAVITSTTTVAPASITRAEVDVLVATAERGNDDGKWTVRVSGLGTVRVNPEDYPAERRFSLACSVATFLNEWGVGVSDWAAFDLTDGFAGKAHHVDY